MTAGTSTRTPGAAMPVRPGGRWLLGLYLSFLAVYLGTSAGHFRSTDEVGVYLTTQSIVERQSLTIKGIFNTSQGPDGLYYSISDVGQSLLSIPLYLVGRLADSIGTPGMRHLWRGPALGDWGSDVRLYFVSLFNQLLSPLIAVVFLLFCLELGVSRGAALLATIALGFGTSIWELSRDYFQHSLEILSILAAIYILYRYRQSLTATPALLAGGALALGVLTRINVVVVAPCLLGYLLVLARGQQRHSEDARAGVTEPKGRGAAAVWWAQQEAQALLGAARRHWRAVAAFLLPLCAVMALTMLVNQVKYGNLLAMHGMDRGKSVDQLFGNQVLIGLYGNLLSPGRSIFLYSPPVLFVLFSYRHFYRRFRAEAWLFASIAALYIGLYSTFYGWDGGWCWGPRYLAAIVPLLIIPSVLWLNSRPRRLAWIAATLAGMGVQFLGVAVNWSAVHLDWLKMRLSPDNAYLFVPDISPIPMHFEALRNGRYVDLWLFWVYQEAGLAALLAALGALVLLFMYGIRYLASADAYQP